MLATDLPGGDLLQGQVVELEELRQAIGAVEGVIGGSQDGDVVGVLDAVFQVRQVDGLRESLQLRVVLQLLVQIRVALSPTTTHKSNQSPVSDSAAPFSYF